MTACNIMRTEGVKKYARLIHEVPPTRFFQIHHFFISHKATQHLQANVCTRNISITI